MNLDYLTRIASELKLKVTQVHATATLIAEGGTVPFIARYRKEVTGEMDEVQITTVRDRLLQFAEVDARREAILKSLEERKLLTAELRLLIEKATTLTQLEDVFAPFRPKRRTRATIATEKGLLPLADWIQANAQEAAADPKAEAAKFVNAGQEGVTEETLVKSAEEALAGARDILAERASDAVEVRVALRQIYEQEATISSKVLMGKEGEPEAAKFRDYFEWTEGLKGIPSHRLLAIRRGEKDGFLLMRVTIPEERGIAVVQRLFAQGQGKCAEQLALAAADGCKRLLFPSMETESRLNSKKRADVEAVRVFSENLKDLMLAPALGEKRVLAIDPGFRTGCKVVVLTAQGALVHHDVVYPTTGQTQMVEAARTLLNLIEQHKIEAVAIGNGTGGRETEAFVRKIAAQMTVIMVNESGASIYSASDAAREEFPTQDITVRGAVSIGRRLMDPLAELVKIDPKSIGVGQYQHDVEQTLLKHTLDDSVISCVNNVGVEVNTASKQLLSYVSGLNKTIAENIVAWRTAQGPFKSRKDLLKVPRLGDKAFEQAAGFLRIRGAENPLDASAVHPERYELVGKIAADLGCGVGDLITDEKRRKAIDLRKYVSESVGLPTLQDIVSELAKPGRDPRKKFEIFSFMAGVDKPTDLTVGMKLPGIVTNVAAFGAFVDIGVHQDGLVHISQMSDNFVKNPAEVLKVQQQVMATVIGLDLARNRISLSLKTNPDFEGAGSKSPGGPDHRRTNPGPARPASAGNGGGGFGGGDWFNQAVQKGKK